MEYPRISTDAAMKVELGFQFKITNVTSSVPDSHPCTCGELKKSNLLVLW